jgi:hypothetical protein
VHTGAVAMATVLNVIPMANRGLSPLVTGEAASGRLAHAATAVLVAVADRTASPAQDTVQVLADTTAAAAGGHADRSLSSAGGEEEVGCSRRLGFRAALMLISRGAWRTGLGG